MFGYAAYYQLGKNMEHQFSASYSPMSQKEPFNFSYVGKPGKRLQMFSELKANIARSGASSEFMSGFRLKFGDGMITGYGTS